MGPAQRWKIAAGFTVLFVAYQLPEGVGQRLLGSFPAQAALLVAFFGIAYLVGRRSAATAAEAYALEEPARWWRLTLALFAAAIALKLCTVAIGRSLSIFQADRRAPDSPLVSTLILGLLLTFAPSIAEDMVTRGFWFRNVITWKPAAFVLTTSALYVGNHIFRLAAGPGEWIMLFTFGAAYALAVTRFGSLWPAVGLHWGWNYGNALATALWPYDVTSPAGSRALAIAAHLVMAAVMLALRRVQLRQL